MKVVMVEDDVGIAKALQKATSEAGYRVRLTGNGREALVILKSEPFDLVLLDRMLPEMEGLEVCRQARAAGSRRSSS